MARKPDTVLIGGGGPVGTTAAWPLARENIPVTLIEAEAGLAIDCRASTIHPPTLDLLEDCGATQAMLDRGLVCPACQYRDRNAGTIARVWRGEADERLLDACELERRCSTWTP